MSSSSNIQRAEQHQGAQRIESTIDAVRQMRQRFSGTPGAAVLLFSVVTAIGVVLSYQVMDSLEESHLLFMWMSLWYVAIAALALFVALARQVAQRLKVSLDNWSRKLARRRADERMWHMAKQDPRLMADLNSAMMSAMVLEDDRV